VQLQKSGGLFGSVPDVHVLVVDMWEPGNSGKCVRAGFQLPSSFLEDLLHLLASLHACLQGLATGSLTNEAKGLLLDPILGSAKSAYPYQFTSMIGFLESKNGAGGSSNRQGMTLLSLGRKISS
jgi:hypothetical protein